jgi:hypothetical protein
MEQATMDFAIRVLTAFLEKRTPDPVDVERLRQQLPALTQSLMTKSLVK